ncbi:MAG: Fic family protein [Candidatus Magasanikbacteria bacterium]|jgi:hypothetical protein|nr:Fic family protein [Candidatus Magasanikbacteria bacterium]MBT4071114.1 Fic family protein [Candidatus Magasanikbacteria bacterium]
MDQIEANRQNVNEINTSSVLERLLINTEHIQALHGQELQELFSSDENIRSFIAQLDEADFINLLNSINGIIRNKSKKDWIMDGENVILSMGEGLAGYTPPNAEDRPMLFYQVLKSIKDMSDKGHDLNDIAILLSSSINAIHAYGDGNGRTSRFFYLLLTQGYNKETEAKFKTALSEGDEDGRDMIDINTEKIDGYLTSVLLKKLKHTKFGGSDIEVKRQNISMNDNVTTQHAKKLLEMLSDRTHSPIALHEFLKDREDADDFLQHYPESEFLGKKWPERYNIKVEHLFENIDDEQAKEILSIYRQIKIKMVELLIDSIEHSKKEGYTDDKGVTILKKFKMKI